MKTIEVKTLFIALLLSTAASSLLAVDLAQSLQQALIKGNLAAVEKALAEGANVNETFIGGHTPLTIAAGHGNLEMAELLIKRGAAVNGRDDFNQTALMFAGKIKMAEFLLQRGAKVNDRDESGWTALMVAVTRNRPELVRLLLENDADINIKNLKGDTALEIAEKFGKIEVVKVIKDFIKK